MDRRLFLTLVSASWALALIGTWLAYHTTWWLEVLVVIGAVSVFHRASSSRASVTNQAKTALWGTFFYLLGFILFASGMALKTVLKLPPTAPTIVAGAGIWAIGIAWACAAALWNEGWFIVADKGRF